MITLVIILTILATVFFLIGCFLGRELLKKFKSIEQFKEGDGYFQNLTYSYPGNQKGTMRNIVLRGSKPFKVLVGFDLIIPILKYHGTDWYGDTEAVLTTSGEYLAVISTWMAKKPVDYWSYIACFLSWFGFYQYMHWAFF